MRRRAVGAVAAVVVSLLAAGSASSASPAAQTTLHWRATVAPLPANAPAGENVSVNSISCPSLGNCTAVGSYAGNSAPKGLLLDETAGHWRAGIEAVLPADARSDPEVSLNSVSCASAGNCTAVGSYITSSEQGRALLLTEKARHWGAGVESNLPGAATSVSCFSAGNCIAVGGGELFTQTAGHWGTEVAAPLPSDADSGRPVEISSVSCSKDGHCSAVGTYNIATGADIAAGEGVLLTKKGGTWQAVKAVMPPDGPGEVVLSSVSCASGGNCSAIGTYNINIDSCCSDEGVLLNETAGKWQRGVKALPPQPARSPVALDGISCSSPKSCVALGDYYVRGVGYLTMLTKAGGTWRRGVKAGVPSPVLYPAGSAISCASPGNCTAVANYWDKAFDGHEHALLVTETAGHWAKGIKAPLGADSFLNAVSCPAPGRCGAVGGVGHAYFQGALLDR